MRPHALALPLLLSPAVALAQSPPVSGSVALPEMVVTGAREERAIEDVPATISVIDREQLDRQNATTPRDAIRYEPGVSFGNQPARGGGTNFVIRGIGGNRVRVQVDGVRLPDFPESNMGAGNYTRDFVDLETVKRIEILRGPASALYGSDALGGVVAYFTKDPSDYLVEPGRNVAFSSRLGYSGADQSLSQSILGAARAGDVEAMIQYGVRIGNEVRPNGNVLPNPQNYTDQNLLAKVVWHLSPIDTLRLTGEIFQRELDTTLNTDKPGSAGAYVLDSTGDDYTRRARVSLDYTHEGPVLFADRVEARAWYVDLDRSERTEQYRSIATSLAAATLGGPTRLRMTNSGFDQSIYGGEVQFGNSFELLGGQHRLVYGATLERIETSRPRDRFEQNLLTGSVTTTVAGETYPNKNFPDTTTTQLGVYVQDEITLGRFTLVPGVRLDNYQLRPHPDADFLRSSGSGTASQVSDLDEFAVSPKLGAIARLDDRFSAYGQYARGFRAPPYDTTNFGFTNRAFGYEILPASNLDSETSDGFEIGLRGRWPNRSNFQVAGYYNIYHDFIDTRVVGNSGGLQQFQYVNVSNVDIYGVEARGEWYFHPNWAVKGSAAYARSEDKDTGRPIDTVDPARFVAGLAWDSGWGLGAEVNLTHALRHNQTSASTYFKAPSYTVLDIAAHYDLGRNLSINAGLFNVTNEKYFLTPDVAGVSATSATRDLYAQPGRYAAVNLVLRW